MGEDRYGNAPCIWIAGDLNDRFVWSTAEITDCFDGDVVAWVRASTHEYEMAKLRAALWFVMRYPNIRKHLGSEVSNVADAALRGAGGDEVLAPIVALAETEKWAT